MNLCHPQDIALANKLQMNLMTVALFHSSSLHSPRPPFFLGKVNIIPGNLCSCPVLVLQHAHSKEKALNLCPTSLITYFGRIQVA